MWPWLLIQLTSAAVVPPPPEPVVIGGGGRFRRPSLHVPAPDVHARVLLDLDALDFTARVVVRPADVQALFTADLEVGVVEMEMDMTATAANIRASLFLTIDELSLLMTLKATDRKR